MVVAAQELSSNQAFAKLHKIPTFYGSYQELVEDENVEVVYIGTINTVHLSTAKIMLNADKHLLIEKPMTCTLKGT